MYARNDAWSALPRSCSTVPFKLSMAVRSHFASADDAASIFLCKSTASESSWHSLATSLRAPVKSGKGEE